MLFFIKYYIIVIFLAKQIYNMKISFLNLPIFKVKYLIFEKMLKDLFTKFYYEKQL